MVTWDSLSRPFPFLPVSGSTRPDPHADPSVRPLHAKTDRIGVQDDKVTSQFDPGMVQGHENKGNETEGQDEDHKEIEPEVGMVSGEGI